MLSCIDLNEKFQLCYEIRCKVYFCQKNKTTGCRHLFAPCSLHYSVYTLKRSSQQTKFVNIEGCSFQCLFYYYIMFSEIL